MLEPTKFVDGVLKGLPDLVIYDGNLPATADALRDLIAASGASMIAMAPPKWSSTRTAHR